MRKNLSLIFKEFVSMPTRDEKINTLRYNFCIEMECILRGAFHPGIVFDLQAPPYKTMISPDGMGYSTLVDELSRVYIFETHSPLKPKNLTKKRQREIMIQLLESLDRQEGILMAGMFNKNLNIPGLDYAIVKEAFPNLLP